MKRSIIVLLHLGFWGCYLIMIMAILAILTEANAQEPKIEYMFKLIFGLTLVPSFIAFYTFYFVLFPKYLKQKKIFLSIVYGLFISLIAALMGVITLGSFFGYDDLFVCEGDQNILAGIIFMTFVACVSGTIALVIQGFITWFKEIKLKETLQQKNHEMELALVKSQLDPHFLFNTINNIDVLIIKKPTEASKYLNKLSDIMRFMLFETKTNEILLTKEIEYIKKYVALQRIRTANDNYVSFSVKGSPNDRLIAPMVFIPFIENAFKHTTNKKVEQAIKICIVIESEVVTLKCENKYNPNRKLKKEKGGLGNELIQKRLNLIYPKRHMLQVSNIDNLYKMHLTINYGKI